MTHDNFLGFLLLSRQLLFRIGFFKGNSTIYEIFEAENTHQTMESSKINFPLFSIQTFFLMKTVKLKWKFPIFNCWIVQFYDMFYYFQHLLTMTVYFTCLFVVTKTNKKIDNFWILNTFCKVQERHGNRIDRLVFRWQNHGSIARFLATNCFETW